MAAAHKRCSLVFVHKIDGILKIQCRIKMKKGRWNVPFHYELRFTDSGIDLRTPFHSILLVRKSMLFRSLIQYESRINYLSTILTSVPLKEPLLYPIDYT